MGQLLPGLNFLLKDMKYFIKIGLLVDIYLIFCLFTFRQLGFYPFFNKTPLVFELLNLSWNPPMIMSLLISAANILLIFFLVKKFFSEKIAFISGLIYAISVWSVYFGIFNLTADLSAFFLLLLGLGLISNSKKYLILATIGSISLLSLSILFWVPILGLLILTMIFEKKLKSKAQIIITVSFIWIMILSFIGFQNHNIFKNEFLREVSIFQDVGLINTVNNFQGELKNTKWTKFGKLIDNKYSYLSLKVLYNFLSQFNLANFFSFNAKLLQFSAEPPILLGFLITLIFGINKLFKIKKCNLYLGIFLLLLLPSIMADKPPELGRLFVIFPVVCLSIAIGIEELKNNHPKIFLLVCFLLFFQATVVLSDIYFREPPRIAKLMQQVYGQNH